MTSHQKLVVAVREGVLERLAETPTLGMEECADRIEAWYPVHADLRALAVELNGRVETCADEAWDELWKTRIRPIRVGCLLVVPPWIEPPAEPDRAEAAETIVIRINPGMGFGTGDHATTRACLALLQRHVRPRSSVLDFGCGSGILSIAAAKLGATHVTGIDCEDVAIENARENALLNDVMIDLRLGEAPPSDASPSDASPSAETFDCVVSNIQASILKPNLDGLRRCLAPGGVLILSGLLDENHFEKEIAATAFIADGPWRTYEVMTP